MWASQQLDNHPTRLVLLGLWRIVQYAGCMLYFPSLHATQDVWPIRGSQRQTWQSRVLSLQASRGSHVGKQHGWPGLCEGTSPVTVSPFFWIHRGVLHVGELYLLAKVTCPFQWHVPLASCTSVCGITRTEVFGNSRGISILARRKFLQQGEHRKSPIAVHTNAVCAVLTAFHCFTE